MQMTSKDTSSKLYRYPIRINITKHSYTTLVIKEMQVKMAMREDTAGIAKIKKMDNTKLKI